MRMGVEFYRTFLKDFNEDDAVHQKHMFDYWSNPVEHLWNDLNIISQLKGRKNSSQRYAIHELVGKVHISEAFLK
jgi:hypothetical protein